MLLIDAKSFRSNPKLHLTMLECGEELEITTEENKRLILTPKAMTAEEFSHRSTDSETTMSEHIFKMTGYTCYNILSQGGAIDVTMDDGSGLTISGTVLDLEKNDQLERIDRLTFKDDPIKYVDMLDQGKVVEVVFDRNRSMFLKGSFMTPEEERWYRPKSSPILKEDEISIKKSAFDSFAIIDCGCHGRMNYYDLLCQGAGLDVCMEDGHGLLIHGTIVDKAKNAQIEHNLANGVSWTDPAYRHRVENAYTISGLLIQLSEDHLISNEIDLRDDGIVPVGYLVRDDAPIIANYHTRSANETVLIVGPAEHPIEIPYDRPDLNSPEERRNLLETVNSMLSASGREERIWEITVEPPFHDWGEWTEDEPRERMTYYAVMNETHAKAFSELVADEERICLSPIAFSPEAGKDLEEALSQLSTDELSL